MRMLHPVWSYGLVSLQFISIGAILMTGAWWSSYWMGLSAQLIGVILPMVVSDTSMQRLAWLLVLVLTLILKLHYEEYLLNRRFGNYRAYQQRSYKLLPWIF